MGVPTSTRNGGTPRISDTFDYQLSIVIVCFLYILDLLSPKEYLDYAVASCPVDCIYWVSREELQVVNLGLNKPSDRS